MNSLLKSEMKTVLRRHRGRSGFTILEVMMALMASLLLMLGLTRAFKLIGDAITTSQSELTMASSLREVTFRLRDEMRRMTPTMSAPQKFGDAAGYFTYYEGPWTDATTTIVNGSMATAGADNYFPTSRYGDLDDYLAFTTRSEPGKPFSGIVPSGVVEAVRLSQHIQSGGTHANFLTLSNTSLASYSLSDSLMPVLIYSELAEIAYFLAPNWLRDDLGIATVGLSANDPAYTITPTFRDVIREAATLDPAGVGDNIPDSLSLRRRVMLVRNDLNLSPAEMAAANGSTGGSASSIKQIPFLHGGNNSVIPIADLVIGGVRPFSPGVWASGGTGGSPDWIAGVARPLQWMDLSISRIVNPANGLPINHSLKANSLDDLTVPENRFAFVRMPASLLGLAAPNTSSMPLLALSQPHAFIMQAQSDGLAAPSGTPFAGGTAGQATGTPPHHHFSMTGFVRPEYTLSDYMLPWGAGSRDQAMPTLRGGSDIVAEDVLSFDIQVFDPTAPLAIWRGRDGVFGTPATGESDDVVIVPSNPGFRQVLANIGTGDYLLERRGGFVDYGYGRLAGGAFGGVNPLVSGGPPGRILVDTPFSGVQFNGSLATTPTLAPLFPNGWFHSGRVVVSLGAVDSFFQPMIDTWTDFYDRDGRSQGSLTSGGSVAIQGSPGVTYTAGQPTYQSSSASPESSRFIDGTQAVNTESTPPSTSQKWSAPMPAAIKIMVRVYDRSAGEVRQQSIIEHFSDQIR